MLPSGSQIERAIECSPSAILPRVPSTSAPAERGTALHAYLSTVGSIGREAALANVPQEWREAAALIEIGALPQVDPAGWAHEVACAYDVDLGVGRELHRGGGRDYSGVGPREVPMTLDLFALSADGSASVVGDWKTGRRRQTAAPRNWQLRAGALAARGIYGTQHAHVMLIYLREDGSPWYDRGELDILDLDVAAGELRRMADAVESAREDLAAGKALAVTTGPHCTYCPARLACPAQTALVRRMATQPAGIRDEITALGPDQLAEAWRRYRAAKRVLDEVRDAVIGAVRAYGEDVDLGDGTVLGERETRRETLDGRIAHEALAALFPRAVADAAVTMETTKAAIDRALAAHVADASAWPDGEKPPPLAGLRRKALDEIRAREGVGLAISSRVGEHARRSA